MAPPFLPRSRALSLAFTGDYDAPKRELEARVVGGGGEEKAEDGEGEGRRKFFSFFVVDGDDDENTEGEIAFSCSSSFLLGGRRRLRRQTEKARNREERRDVPARNCGTSERRDRHAAPANERARDERERERERERFSEARKVKNFSARQGKKLPSRTPSNDEPPQSPEFVFEAAFFFFNQEN